MKNLDISQRFNPLGMLYAMIAAVILLAIIAPVTAHSQALTQNRQATNSKGLANLTVTPTQTFATTSYADLAGSSVTFTPMVDPTVPAYGGGYANRDDNILVNYVLDVTKATATTGSCSAYVNGAVVAATESFISSSAGRGTLTGSFSIANTTSGPQTVKLQCRSGDTNTFTVTKGMVRWTESY